MCRGVRVAALPESRGSCLIHPQAVGLSTGRNPLCHCGFSSHTAAGFVGGRMYVRSMSGTVVQEAIATMRAAHDALAACDLDALTLPELLAAGDELETLTCQLPTQSHRILARLQAEATPKEMGAKSWKRRAQDPVADLQHRSAPPADRGRAAGTTTITDSGNPCNPCSPRTAAAQARGLITAEHVEVIRKSINKLPGFVDAAHPGAVRGRPGAHRGRRRTQGTRRRRRADPVPARPGRPRTRRHRTQPHPRFPQGTTAPRRQRSRSAAT